MADPFLLAHIIAPLRFSIGGVLSPVSIRDQMLRGRMFTHAAYREGLVSSRRPLLVVGAGAAGATAALTAAELRIPTLLIDVADAPFSRQKNCTSRFIDPVQYDWPLVHWAQAFFPPSRTPELPLSFSAGHAARLAHLWTRELNRARLHYHPHFRAEFGAQVVAIPGVQGDLIHATIRFLGKPPVTLPFGAIVSSLGPGVERTWVEELSDGVPAPNAFRGPEFWETDILEIYPFKPGEKILISGGGDGALQDFIRIVTGTSSAREVFENLFEMPMKRSEGLALIKGALAECQGADDQSNRLLHWSSSAKETHSILAELHRAYERQVQRLLADVTLAEELRSALPSRTSAGMHVTLAFPCTHFSYAYGLNRFLALLLLRLLAPEKRVIIRTNVALSSVKCLPEGFSDPFARHTIHEPDGSIIRGHMTCLGRTHQATFVEADCLQRNTAHATEEAPFNVVVVRHGVKAQPNLFGGLGNRARHLLPYYPVGRSF